MDDTVSRQAVLNVLDEIEAQYVFEDGYDRLLQYAKNKVAALPCEYPTPLETIHCTNEQIERLRNTILNALHELTVVRCGKCKYLTDTVSEFDPELHLCAFGLWMEQTDFCSKGDDGKTPMPGVYAVPQ